MLLALPSIRPVSSSALFLLPLLSSSHQLANVPSAANLEDMHGQHRSCFSNMFLLWLMTLIVANEC